jgi:hypothetical protein
MSIQRLLTPAAATLLAALAACAPQSEAADGEAAADAGAAGTAAGTAAEQPNTLTAAESAEGWRLLWDGSSFAGWRGLGRDSVPTQHWKIQDGTIYKVPSGDVPKAPDGQPLAGGDLMTVDAFQDFELSWEWKISEGGNSGLKYNVSEELSLTNPTARAALGFEYQMLDDDRHSDGKIRKHRSGDLYDLIEAPADKPIKPVGEWNQSRVVFRGNHGEHWLNGTKVVEYELGSPAMAEAFSQSKWSKNPQFITRKRGHIVLQDHNDAVWIRSVKIRELQ